MRSSKSSLGARGPLVSSIGSRALFCQVFSSNRIFVSRLECSSSLDAISAPERTHVKKTRRSDCLYGHWGGRFEYDANRVDQSII